MGLGGLSGLLSEERDSMNQAGQKPDNSPHHDITSTFPVWCKMTNYT